MSYPPPGPPPPVYGAPPQYGTPPAYGSPPAYGPPPQYGAPPVYGTPAPAYQPAPAYTPVMTPPTDMQPVPGVYSQCGMPCWRATGHHCHGCWGSGYNMKNCGSGRRCHGGGFH